MASVAIRHLIEELISDFGQSRCIPKSMIEFVGMDITETLNLDRAIALGLYLAAVVPPYLDSASSAGHRVTVSAAVKDRVLTLSFQGGDEATMPIEPLAIRLRDVYAKQLNIVAMVPPADPSFKLSLPLD